MSDNLANLAEARKRKTKPDGGGGNGPGGNNGDGEKEGDPRPVITMRAGQIDKVLQQAELALVAHNKNLYKQTSRMVRVVVDEIKSGSGNDDTIRLSTIEQAYLEMLFGKAARFQKWDNRSTDWIDINCPPKLAETYLQHDGDWKLPYLTGITNTPTLRTDGTVIDQVGYDDITGILYEPQGMVYPTINPNPSKQDAAVALSGILTTLVRRSLPTAPMHAFSAPTAGSGKSLLVDVASVIATGRRASVMNSGSGQYNEELDKKLGAALMSGAAVISIDNLERPLNSDLLCQAVSQQSVEIRVLGKSQMVKAPTNSSLFATGNNLVIGGDMNRRVLVSTLSITDERPELRKFDDHPVAICKALRPAFVVAALTIMVAYLSSKERVSVPPLGGFEEWSRMVAEPLVWLGLPNPADVIAEIREEDPNLERLVQITVAWAAVFGDAPQRIRDVVDAATHTEQDDHGRLTNPDLHDALMAIMGSTRVISPEKLAGWLKKNKNKTVSRDDIKMHLERAGMLGQVVAWRVKGGVMDNLDRGNLDQTRAEKVDNDIPF
jgi:putative DNA primase/helicase